MHTQSHSLISNLGDMLVAFVIVLLAAGLGFIVGLTLYTTGVRMLLSAFVGPTYLFFILVGLGLGYVVNRRLSSSAAPLMWILPTIWSVYQAAHDFNSGIHTGESLSNYLWNTLVLGNHELGLISQWVITAPFVTSLAFSFGAWLAVPRPKAA